MARSFDSPETPAGAVVALRARRRAASRAAPPAIDLDQPADADVAVEAERRRGRGAQSNASGRYEPIARDRLRRRLAEPRGIAAVQDHGDDRRHAQDHHPQRLARHLVRPLDQSVSRLRARLHLLLRAADPRLSRPVAGPRFRIEAVREAGGGRSCWSASCRRRNIRRAPSRSAPTPIRTSRSRSSTRSCGASWKCSSASAIRSASSPSRRWCCATSTFWRAWRSAISPRWRCR